MNETALPEPPGALLCDPTRCPAGASGSYYVHLNEGEVVPITGVTRVEVTPRGILFHRRSNASVTFPREAVYFTCCQRDQSPPQF
jgi:hypothetical protein